MPSFRTGEAAELFTRIESVLLHPRCLNCHTVTAFPRLGDERRRHDFGIARGPENQGVGLRCMTCHEDRNNDASGVPGAPHWQLAPLSMGWEGANGATLCRKLQDPARNGDRTLAALVTHLTEDPLVAWAWAPGRRSDGTPRQPAPIPRDEFTAIVQRWVSLGGGCPQ